MLDRLDETIVSPGHRAQLFAQPINALMVPRQNLDFIPSEDLSQPALRLDNNAMPAGFARRDSMRNGFAKTFRQVYVQRTTQNNVQDL